MLSGINFLNTEQNESIFFCHEMIFYTCFAANKAKHILNRHISCTCSDTKLFSNSIKKSQKVPFWKGYLLSFNQHFLDVKP